MKHIFYLCLQTTREGQASHAHVHEIIKGLRRRGWVVDLFEPAIAGFARISGPLRRLLAFARIELWLWIRKKPDILYVRWHFACWPTALWARLHHVPVAQEVNGIYEDIFLAWPWTRPLARFFIWLMRSQLRWADVVITVTPLLADWVRNQGAQGDIFVVPNGADTELFQPDADRDATLDLPCPYVIFFGALAVWQGIDTMLSAVYHPLWPEQVTLVIVGDGIMRPEVEAEASRFSLVRYLGLQPYARIPALVAGSLAGLSPQNNCGGRAAQTGLFPLKVFETLACGVPIVVTDFPGMADLVVENNCGLVIPRDNPGALATAVAHLFQCPEERNAMGRRGRALVERKHSWDRRAEEMDRILGQS